jgi:Flp pilus assembly protein TadD
VPTESILELLRRLWLERRRTDQPLPPDFGPVAFALLNDTDRTTTDRARIGAALLHVAKRDVAMSVSLSRRVRMVQVEAAYGRGADPAVISELARLKALQDAYLYVHQSTDVDGLWALDRETKRSGEQGLRLAVLLRLCEIRPDVRVLNALAGYCRRAGRLDLAEEYVRASLSVDDSVVTNSAAHVVRVAIGRSRGDAVSLATARRQGRQLIEAIPDDPYALAALGGVEVDLHNLGAAEQLLRRANELRGNSHNARAELRRLVSRYRQAGDTLAADRLEEYLTFRRDA